MSSLAPRAVCYRCHRPRILCICARVPRVENRTPVVILQHPRERKHPFGTARFASLGLSQVYVEIAWDPGTAEEQPPGWLPEGAALLYPAEDAPELGAVPPPDRPRTLVVLDGTWHTARTLRRDKAWLRRLPAFRLAPAAPSRYRIRREPALHCVSTVEAIVEALRVLEPETQGFDALLRAFDEMVDSQIALMTRRGGSPRQRDRRPRAWRGTPRALVEDFQRLVVTYVETAYPDPQGPRPIVQCVALSLATGERFERIVRSAYGLPDPAHLAHMGLAANDFACAVDAATFRRDWRLFLERAPAPPIIAAWNQRALDLLAATTGAPPSRSALKDAYRRGGGGPGSLDDVVDGEGLTVVPLPFRGRAALRLARAVAVARHLNARTLSPSPSFCTGPQH